MQSIKNVWYVKIGSNSLDDEEIAALGFIGIQYVSAMPIEQKRKKSDAIFSRECLLLRLKVLIKL